MATIVWHIRVKDDVSERTFIFDQLTESDQALTCYRNASKAGFDVKVEKVARVKESV